MNDSRGNFLELFRIVSGAAFTASISPSSAAETSHSINQQTGTMLEQLELSSGLGGKVDQNPSTGGVCSLAKITAGRVERGATSL